MDNTWILAISLKLSNSHANVPFNPSILSFMDSSIFVLLNLCLSKAHECSLHYQRKLSSVECNIWQVSLLWPCTVHKHLPAHCTWSWHVEGHIITKMGNPFPQLKRFSVSFLFQVSQRIALFSWTSKRHFSLSVHYCTIRHSWYCNKTTTFFTRKHWMFVKLSASSWGRPQ